MANAPPVGDVTDAPGPHRDDSESAGIPPAGDTDTTESTGAPLSAADLRVLLVEHDVGDAVLVRELLDHATGAHALGWVRTLADGLAELDTGVDCVLVDPSLPDAQGLQAIQAIVDHPAGAAVVVLTGGTDHSLGGAAMLAGAQDFLVKGSVDQETLIRSVRYAVTRRRGIETSHQLHEAQLLRAESARMERGLVARPIVRNPHLDWAVRYEAGGRRALLGGDFFDAIEIDDGTVRVVVGDICGHGADEAALGVALRVAWRALVLSGAPPDATLEAVQRVLRSERATEETFATLCDIEIDGDAHRARVRLAGHPSPLLVGQEDVLSVPAHGRGPLLGVFDEARWPPVEVELGPTWTLVVFTDGIVEGHAGDGTERFDSRQLARAAAARRSGTSPRELADALVEAAEAANGAPLSDDVAIVVIASSEPTPG